MEQAVASQDSVPRRRALAFNGLSEHFIAMLFEKLNNFDDLSRSLNCYIFHFQPNTTSFIEDKL